MIEKGDAGALKRRNLAALIVAGAAALVLLNVILGYVVEKPDSLEQKRCIYSLYRVGVALVEYCNLNGTTVTPASLQALVDAGVLEEGRLRCGGEVFGYFGRFDLLGPRPPLILWCARRHAGAQAHSAPGAAHALKGDFAAVRCTTGYLKEALAEVEHVREVLAAGRSPEDVGRLLSWAMESESSVQVFALWKLAEMRDKAFEATFELVLKCTDEDVRFEAARGLALVGNHAGGAVMVSWLCKPDYFQRVRALETLKALAGDDFGFNPVLEAQSQPGAMALFERWWARKQASMHPQDVPEGVEETGR